MEIFYSCCLYIDILCINPYELTSTQKLKLVHIKIIHAFSKTLNFCRVAGEEPPGQTDGPSITGLTHTHLWAVSSFKFTYNACVLGKAEQLHTERPSGSVKTSCQNNNSDHTEVFMNNARLLFFSLSQCCPNRCCRPLSPGGN